MTRVPTVCALWDVLAEQCGPNTALVDPSFTPPVALTFQQVSTRGHGDHGGTVFMFA
jgi:hypothetical protein